MASRQCTAARRRCTRDLAAADALENIEGPFDVLVCNPPYIRSAVIAELEPEVRDFDPRAALDGGSDGLAFYRRMAPRIPALVPDGWVVFEVGLRPGRSCCRSAGIGNRGRNPPSLSLHLDVAGKRRCVAWGTRA